MSRLDLGWRSDSWPRTHFRPWADVFGQRLGYLREEVGVKSLFRALDGRYYEDEELVDEEDFIPQHWTRRGELPYWTPVILRDSLVNQYWEVRKEGDRRLAVEPAIENMCSLARRVGSMFRDLDSKNRGSFEMSLRWAEEITRGMRAAVEKERSNR